MESEQRKSKKKKNEKDMRKFCFIFENLFNLYKEKKQFQDCKNAESVAVCNSSYTVYKIQIADIKTKQILIFNQEAERIMNEQGLKR